MSNPNRSEPEPSPRADFKPSANNDQNDPPETLSQRQWAIIIVVAFAAFAGFAYSLFARQPVKLVSPTDNSQLAARNLAFTWQYYFQGVSFVVEVYDGSELVMRQITDQPYYQPSQGQKEVFEAGHRYRWQVISNPDVKQRYFKSDSRYFTITEAVEKRVEPAPAATPAPAPQEEPNYNKPPNSSRPENQQPIHYD